LEALARPVSMEVLAALAAAATRARLDRLVRWAVPLEQQGALVKPAAMAATAGKAAAAESAHPAKSAVTVARVVPEELVAISKGRALERPPSQLSHLKVGQAAQVEWPVLAATVAKVASAVLVATEARAVPVGKAV